MRFFGYLKAIILILISAILLFVFFPRSQEVMGQKIRKQTKEFIQKKSHDIILKKDDILKHPEIERDGYTVFIQDMEEVEGGIQIYARAWKGENQLGFGYDGSVDLERFRFFNPPLLVPDGNGDITRTYSDSQSRKFKNDPQESIILALFDTVKQKGKEGTVIIPGKVGNTTDTYYSIAEGDGYLQFQDAVWATSYSSPTASASGTTIRIGAQQVGYHRITRNTLPFLTESIPDTDTITSAVVSLFQDGSQRFNVDVTSADIVQTTQASSTVVALDDYARFGSTVAADLPLASWTTSTYNDFTLNATGISWINKSGYTLLGVRNSRDTDNLAPTGNNIIIAYDADSIGTTQDPKLVIEHYSSIVRPRLSPGAGSNASSLGGSIFW